MDNRAFAIAVGVQVGLAVAVIRGSPAVPFWIVVPVGGVAVGALSRSFQSELLEGFAVGTVATALAALVYFFGLGGWGDATAMLRVMGIEYGLQYQFLLFGLCSAPLVGLVNAVTAYAGSGLRRRVLARRERAGQ